MEIIESVELFIFWGMGVVIFSALIVTLIVEFLAKEKKRKVEERLKAQNVNASFVKRIKIGTKRYLVYQEGKQEYLVNSEGEIRGFRSIF